MATGRDRFYFPPPEVVDSTPVDKAATIADALALYTDVENLQSQIDTNTTAIANLNEVSAASSVTPAYVADLEDMATCPRSDVVFPAFSNGLTDSSSHSHSAGSLSANTSTGNITGSVASSSHYHGMPSIIASTPTYTPDRAAGSSTSYVEFTPFWADRLGKATTISWMVGADTAIFGIDAYYMGLMVYNPATENLEKVWDSGNIKDGAPNTTTLTEVIIDMGLVDQSYQPGQLLYMAHQQIAPGLLQGTRSFACKPQSGIGRPSSWVDRDGVTHTRLMDAASYRSPNRLSAIPSSISKPSLVKINSRIPWGAFGVDTTTEAE